MLPLHHQSVMGMTGVEPASDGLKARCITVLLHTHSASRGTESHICSFSSCCPFLLNGRSQSVSCRSRTRMDGLEDHCPLHWTNETLDERDISAQMDSNHQRKDLQSRPVPDLAHMSGQCSSRTNLLRVSTGYLTLSANCPYYLSPLQTRSPQRESNPYLHTENVAT